MNDIKRVRSFSGDKSYKVRRNLCFDISGMYLSAQADGYSHDKILERLKIILYTNPDYHRLTLADKQYVLGYKDALDNKLERSLIWLKSIDGKLLTTAEVDELTRLEEAAPFLKTENYRSPWARVDTEKSCFVYKDEAGNPRRDTKW